MGDGRMISWFARAHHLNSALLPFYYLCACARRRKVVESPHYHNNSHFLQSFPPSFPPSLFLQPACPPNATCTNTKRPCPSSSSCGPSAITSKPTPNMVACVPSVSPSSLPATTGRNECPPSLPPSLPTSSLCRFRGQ